MLPFYRRLFVPLLLSIFEFLVQFEWHQHCCTEYRTRPSITASQIHTKHNRQLFCAQPGCENGPKNKPNYKLFRRKKDGPSMVYNSDSCLCVASCVPCYQQNDSSLAILLPSTAHRSGVKKSF